jgi:class 3 adenylate cyclase
LLLIHHDPATLRVLAAADSIIPVAVSSLVVAVLVRRWLRSTTPERRVLNPVFAAIGINLVTAIALYAAFGLASRGLISDEHLFAVVVVQLSSLLALPLGLIVGQVRSVLARSAVANLLVRIGEGRSVAELERDVAWVLGDPSVRITSGGADDARAASIGSDGLTPVGTVGAEQMTIRHDPSLRRYQPELLAAVTAATRVALENQRLQAEETLIRSVPAGLAERLQREGGQIGDVGMMRISVLMSDIRGYATIAEGADLETLVRQLHHHRVAMNRVIAGHDGVVMQFVGDAVFAIFGAPEPLDGHALAAVRAAMEMQRAQRGINEDWQLAGLEPFRIGIGVTTGEVAAALLGSPEHVEYSVVGDIVNLAQRIQGWAGDGDVVIGEETYADLGGSIAAERLPVGMVKGRRGAVLAYRIGPSPEAPVPQATRP